MFRARLHPTPFGFAVGLALVALWATIWLWTLLDLSRDARRSAPAPEDDIAGVLVVRSGP